MKFSTQRARAAALGIVTSVALAVAGCTGPADTPASAPVDAVFSVASNDVEPGGYLEPWAAGKYGAECAGDNINPELHWSGAPTGTVAYAITMLDGPKGTTQWLVVNVPTSATEVARGAADATPGIPGRNFIGENGYFGPCPGGDHGYTVKVWALDAEIAFEEGNSYDTFLEGVRGHVLGTAELEMRFARVV